MKKLLLFLTLTSLFSMDLDKYGIVFAAPNLEFVMAKIFKKFYQKYPNDHILVQYESKGKIIKDILNGKDYDLFLSCNKESTIKVYKNNKAITKPKLYAKDSLILFYKNLNNRSYGCLKNREIKTILIGNPNTLYGSKAIKVLKDLHLYNKIKNKIKYKRNIAVVTDNVIWVENEVGFIPKSAINLLPKKFNKKSKNWIEIDPKLYSPIEEYFVISKRGIKKQSVKDFTTFLLSDEGQKILISNGYLPIK